MNILEVNILDNIVGNIESPLISKEHFSFICKQFVWIKKNHISIITYVSQYIILNSQLRPSDSRSSSTYITKRNENYPDI